MKATSATIESGTLPPNNKTIFVPIAQSDTLSYYATIGFDMNGSGSDDLFVYSNASQILRFFWVNVS